MGGSWLPIAVALLVLCIGLSWMLPDGDTGSEQSAGDERCADLVFFNGLVYTADPHADSLEGRSASAMAVKSNRFVAVGESEEILREWVCAGLTRVIDGKGKMMLTPGFYDAHVHTIAGGEGLLGVQLANVRSLSELREAISGHAKKIGPGEWIKHGLWNHEAFLGKDRGVLPTRFLLDDVTKENPVWVCRIDLHMCLANTVALEIAGISLTDPPHVEGGSFDMDYLPLVGGSRVDKERAKEVTGILRDNAMKFILDVMTNPEREEEDEDAAMEAAMHYYVKNGITTIHNMADDAFSPVMGEVRAFLRRYKSVLSSRDQSLGQESPLVRAVLAPPIYGVEDIVAYAKRSEKEVPESWLLVNSTKGFVDGALGSYTALMYEAYKVPFALGSHGLYVTSIDELFENAKRADEGGIQIAIHAIGDKAIHELVELYDRLLAQSPNGSKDRRMRVEHCQHMQEEDLQAILENGLVISVQPYQIIDDAPYLEQALGERMVNTSYRFGLLINAGVPVIFGSDWPVAAAVPIKGIHTAVTRHYVDPATGEQRIFLPDERVTVDQALLAYTSTAAFAEFKEHSKGQIAPGYLADFVILDRDITALPDPDEIEEAAVMATYVDGICMYSSAALAAPSLAS